MSKAIVSSVEQSIAHWVRAPIRALSAYHVPVSAGLIKLDAMENPYTWPAPLVEEWMATLRDCAINRYPDPRANTLSESLRAALGVPIDTALMLGNGSDELIQIIITAVAQTGRTVLAPVPTFAMYDLTTRVAGMDFIGVPLKADFALDRDALLQAIARHQPAVVFISYPNNPTGNLFSVTDIEAILRASPGLVVLDEAYNAFAGGASFLPRLVEFSNMLVLRTLSKQGLAGLRLGMLMGHGAWLAEFDKVRLPYNINVLTQATAAFALRHLAVLDAQAAQLCRDRAALYVALNALPGVQAWPSQTNFILFKTQQPAPLVFEGLRARGVLIKSMANAHPLLADCLRVTVGTPAENAAFLAALGDLLPAAG